MSVINNKWHFINKSGKLTVINPKLYQELQNTGNSSIENCRGTIPGNASNQLKLKFLIFIQNLVSLVKKTLSRFLHPATLFLEYINLLFRYLTHDILLNVLVFNKSLINLGRF
jgi:hypothetical protein